MLNKYGLAWGDIEADEAKIMIKSPLYFVLGGSISSSNWYSRGGWSLYWSETANRFSGHDYNAYDMEFGMSSFDPSAFVDRYIGASLRCLSTN